MTMRFARSPWLRKTLALVVASVSQRAFGKKSLNRRLRVLPANALPALSAGLEAEYSISNTRTSLSPAHDTKVLSPLCGINLTENMLA